MKRFLFALFIAAAATALHAPKPAQAYQGWGFYLCVSMFMSANEDTKLGSSQELLFVSGWVECQ
jgi:hypothetical protein